MGDWPTGRSIDRSIARSTSDVGRRRIPPSSSDGSQSIEQYRNWSRSVNWRRREIVRRKLQQIEPKGEPGRPGRADIIIIRNSWDSIQIWHDTESLATTTQRSQSIDGTGGRRTNGRSRCGQFLKRENLFGEAAAIQLLFHCPAIGMANKSNINYWIDQQWCVDYLIINRSTCKICRFDFPYLNFSWNPQSFDRL